MSDFSNQASDAIIIDNYADLSRYAGYFAAGELPFFLILGSAGAGKSRATQAAAPEAKVIEGSMSALGLYEAVFRAENAPIILDDIDGIYKDPRAVRLLKALCQTEERRHVTWATATNYLQKQEIPNEYFTTSPICIIANEWKELNGNVKALADRGLVVHFDPSPAAVHEKAGEWFKDEEVYSYIGTILPLVRCPSFRTYVKASVLRKAGEDWRAAVHKMWKIDAKAVAAIEILTNTSFKNEDQRLAAFRERTGGSRATWYRLKKSLKR